MADTQTFFVPSRVGEIDIQDHQVGVRPYKAARVLGRT